MDNSSKPILPTASTTPSATDAEREAEVLAALRALEYGTVEVTVHQGRIVEYAPKSRKRFQ